MDNATMSKFNEAIKDLSKFRFKALEEYPVIIREGLKTECDVEILGPPSQINQTQKAKTQEGCNQLKDISIESVNLDQVYEELTQLEYIKSSPEYNVFLKLDRL